MATDSRTSSPDGSVARRPGITLLVFLVAVLIAVTGPVTPGPAFASTAEADARYYRSTVTAIEPAVPGLDVVVSRNGDAITLTNGTGRSVVVLGYSGEPYLRIDDRGVTVNTSSPTAALNADGGRSGVPVSLSSAKPKPARWRPVGEGTSFTWKDFRSQWSAEARPPIVTADPQARHQVFAWGVQLAVDTEPVLVRGRVDWIGLPPADRGPVVISVGAVVACC